MTNILVAVAWPYANSSLHLGHVAGSLLAPDIFARFHRMRGNRVLMVSGSDEHGTPITVKAEAEGVDPSVIAERYHREHAENLKRLGISFDLFFRTSDPQHTVTVDELFLRLNEHGYLEARETDALYCPKENKFLPDRYVEGTCPKCSVADARGDQCDSCGSTLDAIELVAPKCKQCGATPEVRRTNHLFFTLSRFAMGLQDYVDDKDHWRPSVRKFTEHWLREGLKDRPVTRDLTWGIPVPLEGWEGKRIYVWFEAVMGYLSASREWARRRGTPDEWKAWWDEGADARHYYFLGKDNIPFHTIIWPAILLGVGNLMLPYDVPANEFLTMRGEKLSKSRGLVIPVPEYLAKFDPDALRYFLSIVMPEQHDTDFTWEEFVQRNNSELVAALGNYCHRVLHFTNKHFGVIPKAGTDDPKDDAAIVALESAIRSVTADLEACRFKRAMETIMELARAGNVHIDGRAPWTLIASNKEECGTALHTDLRLVQGLCVLAAPFLPFSMTALWVMLGNTTRLEDETWDAARRPLKAGTRLEQPSPLFRRIDPAEIAAPPPPPPAPTTSSAKKPAPATGNPPEGDGPTAPGFPLDLRVGRISGVADHPDADKLYICQVDLGDRTVQVVSGIRGWYTKEELTGRTAVFIANMKKAKLRGAVSEGMVLAAEEGETVSLIVPEEELAPGTPVRPEGLAAGALRPSVDVDTFRRLRLEVRSVDGTPVAVYVDSDLPRPLAGGDGVRCVPIRPVGDGAPIH